MGEFGGVGFMSNEQTILVTGAKGMIGSQLVQGLLDAGYTVIGLDRTGKETHTDNYHQYQVDLDDKKSFSEIAIQADRFIHLAALAHTAGEKDLSWERYKHINVECAKNVFETAGDRPVLFISTVDVYGFYDGKDPVNGKTELHPVTNYGKSKALAEAECKKLKNYTIFRFSPVYTSEIKRDIQKRYYLKFPNIAYQIGKGTSYEILNIKIAVNEMVEWCGEEPGNDIKIIKDSEPMWTPDYVKSEKKAGRSKVVLHFPRWMINAGYVILKGILGENNKVYLLNKAVHPLKSE